MKNETALNGMKAICDYTGFSPPTLLKWHRDEGFPMTQIEKEGIWISDKESIERWRQRRIDPHSVDIMDINGRFEDILRRLGEIEAILNGKVKKKKAKKAPFSNIPNSEFKNL